MKALSAIGVLVLGISLSSSQSLAAGFRLPDQDTAAMGMAGAFVGQADDPSAVWYNPAGITQLDGTRFSGGAMAIFPVIKHDNAAGATDVSERELHLPMHLFATARVGDAAAFGLGVTNPFGLSSNWSETSATRYVATFSEVKTIDVNPNLAYKVNEALSVAAGVNYVKLEATMEKMLDLSAFLLGDRRFRLNGDGDGWAGNAAIKYNATDRLSIGLSYRSKVSIDVDGTASVEAPLPGASNTARTSIVLPELAQLGVSYKASDALTINADLDYTGWSSYDKLVVTSMTISTLTGGATDTSNEEKKWKDTYAVRVGGHYALSEQWKLRAGYVYDPSPVPSEYFDTRVPDADRHAVTLGAGYASGNITIDASYLYLRFSKRTISSSRADDATPAPAALNGSYRSLAHLAGITVGYKF